MTKKASSRDLIVGSVGQDVRALQVYLNTHGYPIASKGLGSLGKETDTFGTLTKTALMKFQKAHSLPASGNFGPLTRGFINKVI